MQRKQTSFQISKILFLGSDSNAKNFQDFSKKKSITFSKMWRLSEIYAFASTKHKFAGRDFR